MSNWRWSGSSRVRMYGVGARASSTVIALDRKHFISWPPPLLWRLRSLPFNHAANRGRPGPGRLQHRAPTRTAPAHCPPLDCTFRPGSPLTSPLSHLRSGARAAAAATAAATAATATAAATAAMTVATRRAENEEAEEYGSRQHPEAGTSVHKARGGGWDLFRGISRPTLRTLSSNRCDRAATTLGVSSQGWCRER